MADAELGVMLEPTNDLQDEVDDVSVGVNGSGGGQMSAGERQEQESVLAGGITEGLAAAGVIGAILSQLKSITGIVDAVLGFFSRSLLPAIEVIADIIRPFISGINDFIADPIGSVGGRENIRQTGQNIESILRPNLAIPRALFGGGEQNNTRNSSTSSDSDIIGNFADQLFNVNSADQTGEQTKNQLKQNVESALRDKTGGG